MSDIGGLTTRRTSPVELALGPAAVLVVTRTKSHHDDALLQTGSRPRLGKDDFDVRYQAARAAELKVPFRRST